MAEQFNEQTWRERALKRLREIAAKPGELAARSGGSFLYGFLGMMTLWPAVEAMKGGDLFGPVLALGSIAGSVGGNLIANLIQQWHDKDISNTQLARQLQARAQEDDEVRQALDAILGRLDIVSEVQAAAPMQERQWFVETLREELQALGSQITIEGDVSAVAAVVGSGTITAENIAGRDIVQVYIDTYIADPSRQIEVRTLFNDYLNALWARLVNLPMLAISDRNSSRDEVPLMDVYTALNVTATISVYPVKTTDGEISRTPDGRSLLAVDVEGLQGGEPTYLTWLRKRFEQEVKEVGEEGHSRLLSALEAAAFTPHRILLGPAGSGKSTFAKFLALCLAGHHLGKAGANLRVLNHLTSEDALPEIEMLPWPHGALLPIFVELRRFVQSAHFPAQGVTGEAEHLLQYFKDDLESFRTAFTHILGYLQHQANGALLILDGLDEVSQAEQCRERLREIVGSFTRQYPNCRVLITSRPYAYRPGSPWRMDELGFTDATLAPFNDEQIRYFVRGWYTYLEIRGQTQADQAEALLGDIKHEAYLRPLAARPLMLTMMTDLHASEGGMLPAGGRGALYERSVSLLLDRWNKSRGVAGVALSQDLGMAVPQIRSALEELAYNVHQEPGALGDSEPADIALTQLWEALDRHRQQDKPVDFRRVSDTLHQRSGILVGESPTRCRFPHRSYQEYLAACFIAEQRDFSTRMTSHVSDDPALWREVALLMAGRLAASAQPFMVWRLLGSLVPKPPEPDVTRDDLRFWRSLYAGLAIQENGLWQVEDEQDQHTRENIRLWLRRTLEVGALPPPDRAVAGRVLGVLGDDRPGVCELDANGVPVIDWVEIPVGPFLMGSTEEEVEHWQSVINRSNDLGQIKRIIVCK